MQKWFLRFTKGKTYFSRENHKTSYLWGIMQNILAEYPESIIAKAKKIKAAGNPGWICVCVRAFVSWCSPCLGDLEAHFFLSQPTLRVSISFPLKVVFLIFWMLDRWSDGCLHLHAYCLKKEAKPKKVKHFFFSMPIRNFYQAQSFRECFWSGHVEKSWPKPHHLFVRQASHHFLARFIGASHFCYQARKSPNKWSISW